MIEGGIPMTHTRIKPFFFLTLISFLIFLWGQGLAQALTDDEKNNVNTYQKASSSVVNVISTVITRDFFFNPTPREGSGSGSIIDPQGHIVTNNHVIRDAQKLEVTLADGSKWPAKLVGTDPDNDLAVIKVEAPAEKIKPLPMGDSRRLQVGQKVLAIGNPFGLGQTLSTGVISSVKRTLRARNGVLMEDIIQTDASINPGNSGGALLDSSGRLIGINTAIFSPTGASVGIGFAIPVSTAKRLVPELIVKGYYAYPWIGATVTTLVSEDARAVGLAAERGALIVETVRGGPAAKAGLQGGTRRVRVGNRIIILGGDVVAGIDGRKLETADDLINTIREKRPGDTVTLEVYRGGLQRDRVQVLLEERPRQR